MTELRRINIDDVLENIRDSKKKNNLTDDKATNILVRVDFNVPMNANGTISDDSRIRASLPTIRKIIDHANNLNCNAILMSHMGRPKLVQKGEDNEETRMQRIKLSLHPVAKRLQALLSESHEVNFVSDCIGSEVEEAVSALPKGGGSVLVLENLRFYKQEEKNDLDFAKSLSSLGDAYINDAFGTCHRAHASVFGVPSLMPKDLIGIGCLVASEVAYLDFDNLNEDSLITAIIGGSKVSTKLPVIKGLLDKVNILVLSGGLAFTFIKAQGIHVGNSLVEDSMLDTAKEILLQAKEKGTHIVLPVDAVCAQSFPKGTMSLEDTKCFDLVSGDGIPDGWMGLDVGQKTVSLLRETLELSTKLVFNGPLGVFEIPPFDSGTRSLVDILEDLTIKGCVTVVGGGDSVAALEAFGKTNAVSYVSTGGGATLELLSGVKLPGVEAIPTLKIASSQ